jgi:hypothetical protein
MCVQQHRRLRNLIEKETTTLTSQQRRHDLLCQTRVAYLSPSLNPSLFTKGAAKLAPRHGK